MKYTLRLMKLMLKLVRSLIKFFRDELSRGTFLKNLVSLLRAKEIAEDMCWAELLEEKAAKHPGRVFIIHEDKAYTYREMDDNAGRVANFLRGLGAKQGSGVAIIMSNSPRYLDVFIGSQKLGMYSVPVNTSLRGDSLLYILNHSDAEFLVIDEEFLDMYRRVADKIEKIRTVIVNPGDTGAPAATAGTRSLADAYAVPVAKPGVTYRREDLCFILYTSGTTGFPKGVVYRYGRTTVKLLAIGARTLLRPSDILYTCLPLFHGNALLLTVTQGMHLGARVVLAKKFSASRFWDDIRKYRVTQFNTIGAIIPILMKQPARETDAQNAVRFTLSAACPADDWEKFEKRFGITIYEGYGAVDGGGKSITNFGTAPVGSIGKPSPGVVYRLVDKDVNDVPTGTPGELIFEARGKGKSVEYYKNEKATNDKLRDGWIHTGDLVRKDKKGYLYFVGRNAEFMRIRGENVSAYEVEHAIQKHPSVVEAAVYAVPSELAEDEIMTSITLVEGRKLREADLLEFLKDNLPKFAVPRYVKIVSGFPKTETQRIIKKELEAAGVLAGTYDAQADEYVEVSRVS